MSTRGHGRSMLYRAAHPRPSVLAAFVSLGTLTLVAAPATAEAQAMLVLA